MAMACQLSELKTAAVQGVVEWNITSEITSLQTLRSKSKHAE
jgi:hypothetical protein